MLISFAVPTFRRCESLRKCLRSILQDPDQDIEVVVSDNASPDGTQAVVAEFRDDVRLRYFRNEENIGMPRNVMETMRRCGGEYIFILTDDDCLRRGAIACLRSALSRHPEVGYLVSPIASVHEDDGRLRSVRNHFGGERLIRPGNSAALLAGRTAYILSRQVIRRDLIDFNFYGRVVQNGYFPCLVAADVARRAPVLCINEVMVWHRVGNIQHWNEFGKNWAEIYFRTHMDFIEALDLAYRVRGSLPPANGSRWRTRGVTDYARLPPGVGLLGFWRGRGMGCGWHALFRRIPRSLQIYSVALSICLLPVWIGRRLLGR